MFSTTTSQNKIEVSFIQKGYELKTPKNLVLDADECVKIITWFSDKMGLQDWAITVLLQDKEPEWFCPNDPSMLGACLPVVLAKESNIWVSPQRCRELNNNIFRTFFHELIHIIFAEKQVADSEDLEFTIDKLSAVFCGLYFTERTAELAETEGNN